MAQTPSRKQLGMADLESALERAASRPAAVDRYVYVETGTYKPWGIAVIAAAKRRGYGVTKHGRGVYYVYPKAPAMPTDDQMLAALGPCGK